MRKLLLLLSTVILVTSCYKKYDLSSVKPMKVYESEWVLPLVNSDVTLAEIVAQYQDRIDDLSDYNLYLEEDNNNLYTIVYENSTKTGYLGDLYSIPDFDESEEFTIPEGSLPGNFEGDTVPESFDSVTVDKFGDTITFELPSFYDATLDKIILESGSFNFSVSSDFNQVIDIEFIFASFKKNNSSLTITETLSESKSNFNYSIDLSGYQIDLTTSGNTNQIELLVASEMMLIADTYFPEDASISYSLSVTDLDFVRIEGNVGIFTFDAQTGTLPISLFDNLEYIDNISFKDPKLQLTAKSTVGATASIHLNEIEFTGKNGTITNLNATQDSFSVAYHTDYNDFANPTTSSFELNNDNSNIVDALSDAPNKIRYEIAATFGQATGQDFWVADTSSVEIELRAELPMDLTVTDLIYRDTISLTLPSEEEVLNAVKKVQLKLIGNNGFGFEIGLQGYWMTSNFEVVDSLFSEGETYIIESAEIDSEGYPKNITNAVSYIELTADEYANIANNATQFVYVANFHTYNNGTDNVKILSTNSFELKMGFLLQTEIETDEYDLSF